MIGNKIPRQSNEKFVSYSQQRTIFHWKEILRFVGFITWLTQPIQPKLVEISVGVPPALQQTSIFLFSFNEKWLYGDYISWIYFQNCLNFFSCQYKLGAAVCSRSKCSLERPFETSSKMHFRLYWKKSFVPREFEWEMRETILFQYQLLHFFLFHYG